MSDNWKQEIDKIFEKHKKDWSKEGRKIGVLDFELLRQEVIEKLDLAEEHFNKTKFDEKTVDMHLEAIDKLKAENDRLSRQYENLKIDYDGAVQDFKDVKKVNEELKADLASAQAELEELKKKHCHPYCEKTLKPEIRQQERARILETIEKHVCMGGHWDTTINNGDIFISKKDWKELKASIGKVKP